MASYLGHISFASVLGCGYGAFGAVALDFDWGPVFLGAGLTTVGGMLPDLDSDSGVPVRELFGVAAGMAPFLIFHRLAEKGFSYEQILVILSGVYLFVRYVLSRIFKRYTIHRGIYHSIPAMFIAGLIVFLAYHSPDLYLRIYLSLAVVLGFLSHLVLDEFCSVDISGVKIQLNKFAGSAFKFTSQSHAVTIATYAVLLGLGYLAYEDVVGPDKAAETRKGYVLQIQSIVRHQGEKLK